MSSPEVHQPNKSEAIPPLVKMTNKKNINQEMPPLSRIRPMPYPFAKNKVNNITNNLPVFTTIELSESIQ